MKHLHYKRRPPFSRHASSCFLLAFFSSTFLCCSAGSSNMEMLPGDLGGSSSSSTSRHLLQTTMNGKVPVVIAEGGAQYLYPEMTMRAYKAAMDGGADFVTCMLAITSDEKAFCHPTFELTKFTDISNNSTLTGRQFRFLQKPSLYSFNFTLDEIKTLRVTQTKPDSRTNAFNFVFPVATPEEVIAEINARAASNATAKRVGIILEISNATSEMEKFNFRTTPTTYAIDLLKNNQWTSPSSPAMVIAKMKTQLSQFVAAGVMVARLFRFLANGDKQTQIIGDDLASYPDPTAIFQSISVNATGAMFPVNSLLIEGPEDLWGRAILRVRWNDSVLAAARNANLSAYVYGFAESDWSSAGSGFNTFLADQVTMYRSLLFGNVSSLVTGVATDWPAAAAKTAACYATPLSVVGNGTNIQTPGMNRPLVISSGGSTALLPAHTNLSFMQAVRDGVDFIDCTLQVSKDGVLFCLESMQLSKYTDVSGKFPAKNKVYNIDSGGGGTADYWSFDLTWEEIQTLTVFPQTRNGVAIPDTSRPTLFNRALPPVSFDEWIGIARNASRTVGIFIKIDNPTFTSGKGVYGKPDIPLDQISLMLEALKKWGYLTSQFLYNRSAAPPLLIASADSCGLQRMSNMSAGTLPLVQRTGNTDNCEATTLEKGQQNKTSWWVSKPGLEFIDSYASGISPSKKTLMKINNESFGALAGVIVVDPSGPNTVVADAQAQKLRVYPRSFRNDVVPGDGEGAYDFLSDRTMELQYYIDQLNVDALESQFVSTAIGYLQSSCRAQPDGQATNPGFTIAEVRPGELAAEINSIVPPKPESVTSSGGDSERRKSVIASVTTVAFVMLVALAVLLFFVYRRTKKRRADQLFRDDLGSLGNLPMLRIFAHNELVAATNNFSEANRLGKGGFGTVYKAVLPDGVIVAVKKLHVELKANESLRSDLSVRQLINEVEIIGTVHNRNVVPLQGVCMDKELLLVYDYMPNGSLQDAIFDPDYTTKLDWSQWFNIAIGTAKGLAYLHEECEQKIIHRDIKPANILLDAQLNPRVADFGLARNVEVDDTHVTTKVMGSIGYMAPDYATTGQLTERSDTYSFGILLLTIITGRKPISFDGSEEGCTLEWVKKKAQDGLEELLTVISPTFEDKYDHGEASRWLYTALLCAQNEPALRPSMGDVVQMLSGKREVPSICVAPATVLFPDYSRTKKGSNRSNDSNSKLSYSGGTPTASTQFENSGIFPGTLDDSVILEGR